MSVARRFVLKSMALGGGASVAMGSAMTRLAAGMTTPAQASQPMLTLVNGSAADPAFLQGAMAAAGAALQVQRVNHDLGSMRALERNMRSGSPLRIIGLLDDAAATLVVDMARSAGARLRWLGQHSATGGGTHHRLLTSVIVADGFSELDQPWATSLGYLLASSGGHPPDLTPTATAPLTGSFVSFLIET